ncbi:hypothetical protein KAR91_52635 [Candidatus Pacearchaeota archaeon]|nr:hypothetical protein [Candidatus Pacearchaeota archaeon]
MKYIVHGEENRIAEMEIFCEISKGNHAARAEMLGVLDNVISAGFLSFDSEGNIHCGGFSESLSKKLGRDISSRGEADEKVFKFHNRMATKMGGA